MCVLVCVFVCVCVCVRVNFTSSADVRGIPIFMFVDKKFNYLIIFNAPYFLHNVLH